MDFEKQFNSFYPTLVLIARSYSQRSSIPYEEFESALCEEFFLKYKGFDASVRDNFTAYMRVVLTQRASRVSTRKERRFYDNVYFYEGQATDEDGEEMEYELADDFDLEKHIIMQEELKTDADKLQLINDLTKETDDATKAIVQEYLRGEHARPTAIGRALGIHHQVVKRKLGLVARNFSTVKYGEISAYLAV